MLFNILEIQKNIEEKRLLWGQKLEQFLLKNIKYFCRILINILYNFFNKNNATFIVCAAIIFVSIFVRSARDIGHDSAAYIAIAEKTIHGEKYHQDFFENNFSLALYLATIPFLVAKFFAISPIIAQEIFVNLLGILSIYFSAQILKKSKESYSRGQLQLVVICFCVGYFLRIYNLQFNEYATKSGYFLALVFPYISYQIAKDDSFLAQFFCGILAGLIICLNPCYALVPIVFEFAKLKDKLLLHQIFSTRNIVTIFLVICYIGLMLKFAPEFVQFLPQFSAPYSYSDYFSFIKEDLFSIVVLCVVALPYLTKQKILTPFFYTTIAVSLSIIFELVVEYDHRVIFYSLSFVLLAMIIFFLIEQDKINWKKDSILILILLLLPQFDPKSFFSFILNLCCLWWIILFVDKKADRCLFIFAAITIFLAIFDKSGQIYWIFSAVIFLTLFKKNISFLAKQDDAIFYLPRSSLIMILLVISYVINLYIAAIFNPKNLYAQNFKSPNQINEKKSYFIQKYAPNKNDEIVFIGDEISDSYPLLVYFDKKTSIPTLNFAMFYRNIYEFAEKKRESGQIIYRNSINEQKAMSYIFQGLKSQIAKSNNKLIFVEKKNFWNQECQIGFLEYYFQDEEFKKIFTKNYQYIGEINSITQEKIINNLLNHDRKDAVFNEQEKITAKTEIYLNKNSTLIN